jgi:hypothetical protein
MFAGTPSIGFPEFKMIGKTVTDFGVAEASARLALAGPSAKTGATAQQAATASVAGKNRQGLIASLLQKRVA